MCSSFAMILCEGMPAHGADVLHGVPDAAPAHCIVGEIDWLQDLGVVGRGKKRVTAAPVTTASPGVCSQPRTSRYSLCQQCLERAASAGMPHSCVTQSHKQQLQPPAGSTACWLPAARHSRSIMQQCPAHAPTCSLSQPSCADGESIPAKRAKLEAGTFTIASEPVRNTVQPEAPEQTTNEALAKATEPAAAS